jgi:hypothetical protein
VNEGAQVQEDWTVAKLICSLRWLYQICIKYRRPHRSRFCLLALKLL